MKKILVMLMLLLSAVVLNTNIASAEDSTAPILVVQEPDHVFAPMGFDNNDNAQLVLTGYLSDTCHKAGPVDLQIDKSRKTVYLRNRVWFYSGCFCAKVETPFLTTVNLGILGVGNYRILVEKADGTFEKAATMPVAIATVKTPDDYLYAPVDQLAIRKRGGEATEVVLSGVFTDSCMSLADVKIAYRPNHVIEILPIAALGKTGCRPVSRPFETTIRLNPDLHGTALVHVRSLNGQSLNQIVEL